MDDLKKLHLLKAFVVSLILTLVFLISPSMSSSSSSSSNQEMIVSTQKIETYLKSEEESPHQLVYIKKTTPFILNHRQLDHHRPGRYNHHPYYYYYRHSLVRRGLHHRAQYFKMMTKKKSIDYALTYKNRPVRPDMFSVMLPKGFVTPSGSSPCHNQDPNSATTLVCGLSTQP